MKKYRLIKSNKFKRILCGGLAVVMLSSVPIIKSFKEKNEINNDFDNKNVTYSSNTRIKENSTTQDDFNDDMYNEQTLSEFNSVDEDIGTNTSYVDDGISIKENNINNDNKNEGSNENYNIIDTSGVIEDINAVIMDFNENEIYNLIDREKRLLDSVNIKENLKDINNYSWYVNGKIDKEKLIYKLTTNVKNSGNKVDANMLRIINATSDAIIDDNEILKKKNPNYDFKIAYQIIDNLVVGIDSNIYVHMLGYYSIKYKNIVFNPKILDDFDLMKKVSRHEILHLFQDGVSTVQEFGNDDWYSTEGQPLRHNFLYERFADSLAMESMGKGLSGDYQSEEEKLKKLCMSTGKSISYFENAIINHDAEALVNCFEEECSATVTACLYELDIACGYDFNKDVEYRSNCYDAAMIKLYKNACIRLIKEYGKRNITFDELNRQLDEIKDFTINNCDWDYKYTDTRKSLENCANEVQDICLTFAKTKVK